MKESISTKIQRGDYDITLRDEAWTRFKQDLLRELHLTAHPMAEKLYDIAWVQCRRQGLQSIVDLAYAMSELLET